MFKFFRLFRRKPKALPPPPPRRPDHVPLVLDLSLTKVISNPNEPLYVAWHPDLPRGVARRFEGNTADDARAELAKWNGHLGCSPGCPACSLERVEAMQGFFDEYGHHLGSLASEHVDSDQSARLIGESHGWSPVADELELPPQVKIVDFDDNLRELNLVERETVRSYREYMDEVERQEDFPGPGFTRYRKPSLWRRIFGGRR